MESTPGSLCKRANLRNCRELSPVFLAFSAFVSALSLVFSSCTLFTGGDLIPLEIDNGASREELAVAARFVSSIDDVPGFFRTALADSGILAVQIAIRNGSAASLRIHDSNGMDLGPEFKGIRLVCGKDTLDPVPPQYACAALLGSKRTGRYRVPTALEIAASPIFPPYAAYSLYKELSVGRFYRPLRAKSFFENLPSGLLLARRLEPGEELRGWVYFEKRESSDCENCEIVVTACIAKDEFRTIEGYDFAFVREESSGDELEEESAMEKVACRCMLSLVGEGKKSSLHCTPVSISKNGLENSSSRIADINAKETSIADASCRGDRMAVALNFVSKSRILSFRCNSDLLSNGSWTMPRAAKRVFQVEDGIIAVSRTGVGYFLGATKRTEMSHFKLSREVEDAALDGERLIVFDREMGNLSFGVSSEDRFALLSRSRREIGAKRVIGASSNVRAILGVGKSLVGDTLLYCDRETGGVMRRIVLPGRVYAASLSGSSAVIQLEDGTLMKTGPRPLGKLQVEQAGWLPFKARAILALPEGFIAVASDGRIADGFISTYNPARAGAVETSTRVLRGEGSR